MTRDRATSIGIFLFGAALVLLTAEVAVVSVLRYFTTLQTPPDVILANRFSHPFLWLHVGGGVTALVVAPLQFVKRVRERFPAVHRITGRVYVGACAVAAPAGFMLAIGSMAGPIAGTGFAISAVLWSIFTFLGVRSAIRRRFDEHRAWIIRSYAITSTAITLRLMLPFSVALMKLPFVPAYQVIAWASWIANLAIAEIYLRRKQRNTLPIPAALATA